MKDIPGYDGKYAITEDGRVWSYKTNRFLKPALGKSGYLTVCLSNKCKKTSHYLHRLVAEAFIPNPDNLPVINHKNEIKSDNSVENLEWMTQADNLNYGTCR